MYNKDENIKVRVKNALDVSGSFDNCFFHNYALHLLANQIPLPKDLFHFASILNQESKAKKLVHLFSNQKSLDKISLLDTSNKQTPNYLFEKTLILGFLFREWFPTKLSQHPEVGQEMLEGEHGVLTGFNTYKEYRSFMSKEELYTSEFSVLYEANQEFLEYFYNRSQDLGEKNSHFEAYFDKATTPEEAIRNYWQNEGFVTYCNYMAQTQVKLSSIEIMVMMKFMNQPFIIYDRATAAVVDEYHYLDSISPPFEVALHALEGHYFLLKSKETEEDLDEYEKSHRQYKEDRSILLSNSNQAVSSLLVRSTCPKGLLDEEPFNALIERLAPLENLQQVSKPTAVNHNFLLNLGASLTGTSAVLVTLMGIAIVSGQYDPGPSLIEEAVATTAISSVASLGYGLYKFFTSDVKPSTDESSKEDLSQKLKTN